MGLSNFYGATTGSQPYLLLLSDSPEFLYLFERYAKRAGYLSWSTASLEEALQQAASHMPAALVLDGLLVQPQGAGMLQQFHDEAATSAVPLLLCAAREGIEPDLELLIDARLMKPVMYREFLATLNHLGVAPSHVRDHPRQ